MNTIENSLWVEKYRPTLVKDVVLPDRIKTIFQSYVDRRDVPNLLLIGSAGTGKTTIARALGNELGSDILFINASDDRGIANLRTKVKQFASITSSELGLHKLIIMDEGDNLSPDAIMALRGFIEQCSSNARFIFTANYEHKFPDPIKSRLQTVTFSLNKDENKKMMTEFAIRIFGILQKENIEVTDEGKKATADMIKRLYPDMRKILNEIQKYSQINNKVDEGLLFVVDSKKFEELVGFLKSKSFNKVRDWLANNSNDNASFYNYFYNNLEKIFKPSSIPEAILITDEFIYKSYFSFNKEICQVAYCVNLMSRCE